MSERSIRSKVPNARAARRGSRRRGLSGRLRDWRGSVPGLGKVLYDGDACCRAFPNRWYTGAGTRRLRGPPLHCSRRRRRLLRRLCTGCTAHLASQIAAAPGAHVIWLCKSPLHRLHGSFCFTNRRCTARGGVVCPADRRCTARRGLAAFSAVAAPGTRAHRLRRSERSPVCRLRLLPEPPALGEAGRTARASVQLPLERDERAPLNRRRTELDTLLDSHARTRSPRREESQGVPWRSVSSSGEHKTGGS